jgi:hypothetical protein
MRPSRPEQETVALPITKTPKGNSLAAKAHCLEESADHIPAWLNWSIWTGAGQGAFVKWPSNQALFAELSGLLAHGALAESKPPGTNEAQQTQAQTRLLAASKALEMPWKRGMRELARSASVQTLGLRAKPMRIHSPDPLARRTLFCEPTRVPALLQALWSRLPAVDTPALALQWALCLLTIHPMQDGNGRSARLAYAALLWRMKRQEPILLIAFALLFERSHSLLQLSLLDLRLGNRKTLQEGFANVCQRAESEYGSLLEEAGSGKLDEAARRAYVVDSVRQRLAASMHICPVHPL